MGDIGRELIRRTRERIIHMERVLDMYRTRGGFAQEIESVERELRQERENLDRQMKLEGGE